jgi:hypothetical protein
MLRTGFAHVLQNMTLDITHKDNKLIMRDKPSKDLDDQIAASRLYGSVKRISCCCRKGSSFEKDSGRFDTQGRQDVRAGHMQRADWKLGS